MRTFHIGGAATRRAEQSIAREPLRRHGEVRQPRHGAEDGRHAGGDEPQRRARRSSTTRGRERERYQVIYGAQLLVKEGQKLEAGTLLAEWDPFAMPLLTEVGGIVRSRTSSKASR